MMKQKVLASFLAIVTAGTYFNAQCTIIGKSSIGINEHATYTVENSNAQCSECYLWNEIGTTISTGTSLKQKQIQVKGTTEGRSILSVIALTTEGVVQCNKIIDVVSPNSIFQDHSPQTSSENTTDCDIETKNFTEVKAKNGIFAILLDATNDGNTYNWYATYSNGEVLESNQKLPQFPYNTTATVTKVQLKVVSKKCLKTLSKSYEVEYWTHF